MNVTQTATLDDTQEFRLKTRPIVNADFTHGYNALNGHLVVYRHFRDSNHRYFGKIYSVFAEKYGLAIYVKPEPGQGLSLVKPYHISEVALFEGWE